MRTQEGAWTKKQTNPIEYRWDVPTWDEVTDSSYQIQMSWWWLLWKQSQEKNQPYKQLVTNKQTNSNKQLLWATSTSSEPKSVSSVNIFYSILFYSALTTTLESPSQTSRWYLKTSRVVIAWHTSHLANSPKKSASDKPGLLMRPILSNLFHFVSFGTWITLARESSKSARSGNHSQHQCLSNAVIFYELTSYRVGSL